MFILARIYQRVCQKGDILIFCWDEPLWNICFHEHGDFALVRLQKVSCYGLGLNVFAFSLYELGGLLLKIMAKQCAAVLELIAMWARQQYSKWWVPTFENATCIGFTWQGFDGRGGLQGWLLWEDARCCLHVEQSKFQRAPRESLHWPRLSPSATLVAPLG